MNVVDRRKQEKRLNEFMRCGQTILVRKCGDCGHDREGSGTFEGTRTCKCRACPACAWVRARKVGELIESTFDLFQGDNGYHWQLAVVTIKYDPADPEDLSAAALRSRALLAGRVAKTAWNDYLKVPGAAMLRTIECSKRGHVHLNLIYFGPAIDKEDLEEVTQADDCRVGFSKVQNLDSDPAPRSERVKCDDPRGSKKALATAARYAAKGIETGKGGNDEEWLSGQRTAKVVDPVLAARWEVATYRLQLMQRYGRLRGLKFEEHGKEGETDHEDDAQVACRHCGSVGAWETVGRRAEPWIQDCHERGFSALLGSSWTPKARDGPDYPR